VPRTANHSGPARGVSYAGARSRAVTLARLPTSYLDYGLVLVLRAGVSCGTGLPTWSELLSARFATGRAVPAGDGYFELGGLISAVTC